MGESRRLAMRRAHAHRPNYCTCGKIVYGNGGKAAHKTMHERRKDGNRYITQDEYQRRRAEVEPRP